MRRVLADPAIQERIRVQGIEAAAEMSQAQAAKWLANESDKWSAVIREKGIKVE